MLFPRCFQQVVVLRSAVMLASPFKSSTCCYCLPDCSVVRTAFKSSDICRAQLQPAPNLLDASKAA